MSEAGSPGSKGLREDIDTGTVARVLPHSTARDKHRSPGRQCIGKVTPREVNQEKEKKADPRILALP